MPVFVTLHGVILKRKRKTKNKQTKKQKQNKQKQTNKIQKQNKNKQTKIVYMNAEELCINSCASVERDIHPIQTGDVPMDWNTANITAISKKGEKSDPGN